MVSAAPEGLNDTAVGRCVIDANQAGGTDYPAVPDAGGLNEIV